MRRAIRFAVGPILLGLLATHQADARGGGGGFGGFHGGSFGGFRGGVISTPTVTFRADNNIVATVRRPAFVRNRHLASFGTRRFLDRRFLAFPNQYRNQVNAFPVWWEGGWGLPVWGWPSEYVYTQPAQQVQAPPVEPSVEPSVEPQVIVISTDGQGRMTTAAVASDVSYIKGCHAIPNGYHCDTATEAN